MLRDVLLAGAGGFAGSALRFAVSYAMASVAAGWGFPIGTLLVNALGSFAIGLLWTALPAGGWQVLAVAGFCGGFTTFSTFSLESLRMLRNGETAVALGYMIASAVICVLLAWAGMAVAERWLR